MPRFARFAPARINAAPEQDALTLLREYPPGFFTPSALRQSLRLRGHGRLAAWLTVDTLLHHSQIYLERGGRIVVVEGSRI